MRILVVDDSVVFRTAIKQALEASNQVSEVKPASNGKIGLDFLNQSQFDGVTVDLEMPVMDGVELIKEIRKVNKDIPIIIFSAQNPSAANKTLLALDYGANDFLSKVDFESMDVQEKLQHIQDALVARFSALRKSKGSVQVKIVNSEASSIKEHSRAYLKDPKPSLIVIGSSTGGPDTLKSIVPKLSKNATTPVLIIQHMPPVFTEQFAKSLNKLSHYKITEAKDGDQIKSGHCYIAPGDYHLKVRKHGDSYFVVLDQSEKVCYVRPSIDVTLESLCQNYTGKCATFILTGMGSDGANGCKSFMKKSHLVFAQDEATSTVWGMPKAVYESGAYTEILPLDEVSEIFNKLT